MKAKEQQLRKRLLSFVPESIYPVVSGVKESMVLEGCVLFADVAGFTAMTEKLASIGREGAEELTRILNEFNSAMITVCRNHGGDVLRFGGDAMTIFFRGGLIPGLRASALMQEESMRFSSVETRGGLFSLAVKIGVSTGSILVGLVGDGEIGNDYFATGAALDRAAEAEHHAVKGQIVLSPECASGKLPAGSAVKKLDGGFLLVTKPCGPSSSSGGGAGVSRSLPSLEALSAFLPSLVRKKASLPEGLPVGEHRKTTVLFLSFSGIDYESDDKAQHKLRAVYGAAAAIVKRYGGWINKLDMGDKGSKLIILFGAPLAIENQEEAACRAALDIMGDDTLRNALTDLRIGITSAPLFMAWVGSDERREFTVMGDGINLAARLMANAHSWRVLVDREVMERASHEMDFVALDPIFVKGKREKVAIFRPVGERKASEVGWDIFIGRRDLTEQLLPALSGPSSPALVSITGEPGVGKSAFLHHLGQRIGEVGILHVTVPLTIQSAHGYMSAWKNVLLACLGISRETPPETKMEALRAALSVEDARYIPLLGPLTGLDLPETEETKVLSPGDRRDILFAVLTRIIGARAKDAPYGVFLDQMENADPASIEFLESFSGDPGRNLVKLVVVQRSGKIPELKLPAEKLSVEIPPFNAVEIAEYLVDTSGFAEPTENILSFLEEKTGGNPKFLEQFIFAMQKENVASKGPSGRIEVDEELLRKTTFPDTLEGVMLSRLEALSEEDRHLLKAASVLGSSFSLNLLAGIIEKTLGEVLDAIRLLEERGILRRDSWGTRPYATFRDSLLREAVYQSLNYGARRDFHLKAALTIKEGARVNRRLWPILAYHFEAAEKAVEACFYLWGSAEDAVARFDNRSAYDLLSRYTTFKDREKADIEEDDQYRKALLAFAKVGKALGRKDEAGHLCERLVNETKSLFPERIDAEMQIAGNMRLEGNLEGSLKGYDRAMKEAKKIGNLSLQCRILLDSGVPMAVLGKVNGAIERFKRAEELALEIGDHPWEVYAVMNQGMCLYHFEGDTEGALSAFQKAKRLAVRHALKPQMVRLATNLSQLYFERGEYPKALKTASEGIETAGQLGYRQPLAVLLSNCALFEAMLCRWDSATFSSDKALSLANQYKMDDYCALSLHTKGILALATGNLAVSLDFQGRALGTQGKGATEERALGYLGEMVQATNGWKAPRLVTKDLRHYRSLFRNDSLNRDLPWVIAFDIQLLRHKAFTGPVTSIALERADGLVESALNCGYPWLLAEVGEACILLHLDAGDFDGAVKSAERIRIALSGRGGPLKMAPFLLALAKANEAAGDEKGFLDVFSELWPLRKYWDRGLTGVLLWKTAARAAVLEGRPRAEAIRRKRAMQIARKVLELQEKPAFRKAFLAIPEVAELLREGEPG